MTLREYIDKHSKKSNHAKYEDDYNEKQSLGTKEKKSPSKMADGNHQKYDSSYEDRGMKGSDNKLPKGRMATAKDKPSSSDDEYDRDTIGGREEGTKETGSFFRSLKSSSKYSGDHPEGRRGRDETPSSFTSRPSSNRYDTDRAGDTGSEKPMSGKDAFLRRKQAMPGYKSSYYDTSRGSADKERHGADTSFFAGKGERQDQESKPRIK